MDTYTFYLKEIKSNSNKNSWRVKNMTRTIQTHISGLRLTANKMKGTYVGKFASAEANRIEKELEKSLKLEKHETN